MRGKTAAAFGQARYDHAVGSAALLKAAAEVAGFADAPTAPKLLVRKASAPRAMAC